MKPATEDSRPIAESLEESLDDVGRGLSSGCYDEATARGIARNDLDRLGLANWTVTVDERRRPDGHSLCAYFIVDPAAEHVELIGMTGSTGDANPYESYAKALADQLDETCLSLEAAASVARSLAAETVIMIDGTRIDLTEPAGALVVNEVEDPAAACTRSAVNIGGLVQVILRGPST